MGLDWFFVLACTIMAAVCFVRHDWFWFGLNIVVASLNYLNIHHLTKVKNEKIKEESKNKKS